MARPRSVSDADIFRSIFALLAEGGSRAVSFASVAQTCGLSAPSLVQRFASRDGMLRSALLAAWDRLDAATAQAEAAAPLSPKGAATFLKAMAQQDVGAAVPDLALLAADFRDPVLRKRASDWRARVEQALAVRLGAGSRDKEGAAMLFAAWQGRLLWAQTGSDGFRLREGVRRLAGRD